MRLEHGTLDQLNPQQFREEVALAVACIAEGGIDAARSSHNPTGCSPSTLHPTNCAFFIQTQFGLLVAKYNATGPIDFIQGCFRFAKPGG